MCPLLQEKPLGEWEDYFKRIVLEDVRSFQKKYKGSEEERSDIKQHYLKCKGKCASVFL